MPSGGLEAFNGFAQTSHKAHTVGLYIGSYQGFCDETHTRPGAKIIVDVCYTVLPLEGVRIAINSCQMTLWKGVSLAEDLEVCKITGVKLILCKLAETCLKYMKDVIKIQRYSRVWKKISTNWTNLIVCA